MALAELFVTRKVCCVASITTGSVVVAPFVVGRYGLADRRGVGARCQRCCDQSQGLRGAWSPPNSSRLSCGRRVGRRGRWSRSQVNSRAQIELYPPWLRPPAPGTCRAAAPIEANVSSRGLAHPGTRAGRHRANPLPAGFVAGQIHRSGVSRPCGPPRPRIRAVFPTCPARRTGVAWPATRVGARPPDGAGVTRSSRRLDHHVVHACAQPGRARRPESCGPCRTGGPDCRHGGLDRVELACTGIRDLARHGSAGPRQVRPNRITNRPWSHL